VLSVFVIMVAAPVVSAAVPAAGIVADYVALGDSYSSGLGAGHYQNARCQRSALAYPVLWHASHPSSLTFVACSGATAPDVTKDQLTALGTQTTLVSLSVGGSDAGFVSVLKVCHLGGDADCSAAVGKAEAFVQTVLPTRLDALYQEVRARAPHALVVVVGYPRLFELGPCASRLSEAKRSSINHGADTLATVLADRVVAAGFTFLDAKARFAGHGICGPDPWLNDLNLSRLNESYHPNARGQSEGYLAALTAITG
jgi:lysophospholipase L1-like esterase